MKDTGRFAKPEGNTGIWGGHPKVSVATSFTPWSSSLSSSLIPKRQQLVMKVFLLGQISSFCSGSEGSTQGCPRDGKVLVLGSTSPRERWPRGAAHPESITALPSCFLTPPEAWRILSSLGNVEVLCLESSAGLSEQPVEET